MGGPPGGGGVEKSHRPDAHLAQHPAPDVARDQDDDTAHDAASAKRQDSLYRQTNAARGIADGGAAGEGRPELLDWAGKTRLHDVKSVTTTVVGESHGDKVVTVSEYAFAMQGDRETSSDAVFAVRRTMSFDIKSFGGRDDATVRITSRAHLNVDQIPNDITSLVSTPARLVSDDGLIEFRRLHSNATYRHAAGNPEQSGKSVAALVGSNPLLAFQTPAAERIAALEARSSEIVAADKEDKHVDEFSVKAPSVLSALRAHRKAVESYEDGSQDTLQRANEYLREIVTEMDELKHAMPQAGDGAQEAKKQHARLEALYNQVLKEYNAARAATPPKKDALDHLGDLAMVPVHLGKDMVMGAVELGKMGIDVVRKGIDVAANQFGYELDWEPYSGIGKGAAAGKSGTDILVGIWDAFADQASKAFEHARNGDYSKLAEFSVDTALLLDAGASLVAKAPAAAAKVGSTVGKVASAPARVAARLKALAEEAKKLRGLGKGLDAWATKKLGAITETLTELVGGAIEISPDGSAVLPDPAKAAAMFRLKDLGEAVKQGVGTLGKRRVGSKVEVAGFGERIEQLGARLGGKATSDLVDLMEGIERSKSPLAYLRAAEELLDLTPSRILREEAVAILQRSTVMTDPVAFLDDVRAFADRKLTRKARSTIYKKVAAGEAPDLNWLRQTTLSDRRLDKLASDSKTNWKSFMKVSETKSDQFPTKLARRDLEKGAFADANMKLRGIAGEIVADEIKLPHDLSIVDRQVAAGSKVIDFRVTKAGKPGWLEVKSWTNDAWKRELTAYKSTGESKMLTNLFEQLDAAKATQEPVYLAVTTVEEETMLAIERVLARRGFGSVVVFEIEESKVAAVAGELRNAMKIGRPKTSSIPTPSAKTGAAVAVGAAATKHEGDDNEEQEDETTQGE